MQLEGALAADRVWMTCCALHDMLLEVDGLNNRWEEGAASDWQGDMGTSDAKECRCFTPFAIRQSSDAQLQNFGGTEHERSSNELTVMIDGNNNTDPECDDEDMATNVRHDANGSICLNSLSHRDFRERLVEHFDVLHATAELNGPQAILLRCTLEQSNKFALGNSHFALPLESSVSLSCSF